MQHFVGQVFQKLPLIVQFPKTVGVNLRGTAPAPELQLPRVGMVIKSDYTQMIGHVDKLIYFVGDDEREKVARIISRRYLVVLQMKASAIFIRFLEIVSEVGPRGFELVFMAQTAVIYHQQIGFPTPHIMVGQNNILTRIKIL